MVMRYFGEYVPSQGDICKLNAGQRKGHEFLGYRPYICLSHSLVSRYSNTAVFAPISTTERKYPFYIKLSQRLETSGVVMLDQLATLDYAARGANYVETVGESFLNKLLETVKLIFEKD